MGYMGIAGTAADEVKVWIPRNVLPTAILRSPTLISGGSTSKRKHGSNKHGDGEETLTSNRAAGKHMKNRTTMRPSSSDEASNN